MPAFTIETEIEAPKRVVWQVFSGLSAYENWNPFIVDAVGSIRHNVDLSLKIVTPSGNVTSFNPHVEHVDSGNKAVWSTGNILFSRRATFVIKQSKAGKTSFTTTVTFHGILAGMKKGFVDDLENGYRTMAEALKKRAEHEVSLRPAG